MDIGGIGNYYGGLEVKKESERFWWSIEDWNGHYWEEITESLYNELVKHQQRIDKQQ